MAKKDSGGLCNVNIKNLSVRKGGDVLLDNINISFNCGELTALIGANGAGKTTLLRAVLGEIRHDGEILHEDHVGKNIEKVTVGYVPQHLEFDRGSPVSVYDFLALGRTKKPTCFFSSKKGPLKTDIDAALQAVGGEHIANRRIGELSGGELQRVLLAQALYPMPELMVLDEPVSGVDYAATEQFYKMIAKLRSENHIAIAMVSHDLELVRRYADKVILLNKQVLTQGTPEEVYNTEAFRKIFYQNA
ncbi:MAG: metal ABC transporter ATP-binding protein [Oscillospiraceae bacterium]|jgi:zinc transport system ATP-binding protein|nr:metal ABC transporter ATP-binding protein [Oscillospiraceae bacterium]